MNMEFFWIKKLIVPEKEKAIVWEIRYSIWISSTKTKRKNKSQNKIKVLVIKNFWYFPFLDSKLGNVHFPFSLKLKVIAIKKAKIAETR